MGWEDGLRPLSDYIEDLLWFIERQKEAQVDIPYLFHAGETLGDGSKADMVRVLALGSQSRSLTYSAAELVRCDPPRHEAYRPWFLVASAPAADGDLQGAQDWCAIPFLIVQNGADEVVASCRVLSHLK